MLNNKNNIKYMIGIMILFIGTLLPSIKIAQENISFLKENGILTIILVGIMFTLIKLEKKQFIIIPSTFSLVVITKFIIENQERLNKIIETYNSYAKFRYGLLVMIIGNIILITSLIIEYIDYKTLKEKISNIIQKLQTKKENHKKLINASLIEKLRKKETTNKITTETTEDGKIKYNKITVKVDKNTKEKEKLTNKISNLILKLRLKRISNKKLSITKFQDQEKIKKTYYVSTIDIKKWTRDNISCINCGAKINSSSEYCFLCDCKINLQGKHNKIS